MHTQGQHSIASKIDRHVMHIEKLTIPVSVYKEAQKWGGYVMHVGYNDNRNNIHSNYSPGPTIDLLYSTTLTLPYTVGLIVGYICL